MKNIITKMKNTPEGINRVGGAQDQMAIWKIRQHETPNHNSKRKKESKKKNDSLRGLWDDIKCTDICIMEVLEEEENKD